MTDDARAADIVLTAGQVERLASLLASIIAAAKWMADPKITKLARAALAELDVHHDD